jgi:hypothetical protein
VERRKPMDQERNSGAVGAVHVEEPSALGWHAV